MYEVEPAEKKEKSGETLRAVLLGLFFYIILAAGTGIATGYGYYKGKSEVYEGILGHMTSTMEALNGK